MAVKATQPLIAEPVARILMRVSSRDSGDHRKTSHHDAGYDIFL
jgi:hypothetical protein